MQPALGIEDVREREQVVLVRPAAVVEDEERGCFTVSRPLSEDQRAHRVSARP